VVDKKTGLITGWVYSKGANKVPLQLHEVIFFRYWLWLPVFSPIIALAIFLAKIIKTF